MNAIKGTHDRKLLPVLLKPGEHPALHVSVAQAAQQGGQDGALGDPLTLDVKPGERWQKEHMFGHTCRPYPGADILLRPHKHMRTPHTQRAQGTHHHCLGIHESRCHTHPRSPAMNCPHTAQPFVKVAAGSPDSLAPNPYDVVVHQAQEVIEQAAAGFVQRAALEKQVGDAGEQDTEARDAMGGGGGQ